MLRLLWWNEKGEKVMLLATAVAISVCLGIFTVENYLDEQIAAGILILVGLPTGALPKFYCKCKASCNNSTSSRVVVYESRNYFHS